MEFRGRPLESVKVKKVIRLSKSCLGESEKQAVLGVLESEYLGMGKEVQYFEEELTKFFGRPALCVANGTAAQRLTNNGNDDNDGNLGGSLTLFNPSDTTFVKHFTGRTSAMHSQPASIAHYVAGYFNTASDIDAIQFSFNSGTIDSGDICLYGIS